MPENKQQLDEFFAPSAVNITSNSIQVGQKLARTLFISTLPRYLNTNWFSPVINLDRALDVSIFVHPQDTGTILKQLRDKLGRLQAQEMEETSAGKVRDPVLETAIADIETLRDRLQLGTDKFFELGIYITIYAQTAKELDEIEGKIKNFFDSQLISSRPATFRMKEGFESTLPLAEDKLTNLISLNTEPASSVFPFVSFDLTTDQGILYGINTHNNSLILFDRFDLENANEVVFGKSGGGKSILGSDRVLVKNKGRTELRKIGPLIEELISKHGPEKIDEDLEGVINPGLEVWSFDKNIKGSWSKVTVAARKKAPEDFYKITTKSGRSLTTTGDHNMVILKNGQITMAKSSEIKKGQYLPLPREVRGSSCSIKFLNLLQVLREAKGVYIGNARELLLQNYNELKKAKIDDRYDKYLYKYKSGRSIPIQYFLKIAKFLGIDTDNPLLKNIKIVSKLNLNALPLYFSVSEDFMKILGYIIAEGTITQDYILISNLDREFLNDAKLALKNVGVLFYFGNRGIIIAQRTFVELCKALGVNGKSGEKSLPPLLFNLESNLAAAFIRGYFEGDGGVEHNSVNATSKSKDLISGLSYLMYYFGIVGRIKRVIKKSQDWTRGRAYWKLSVSGQKNLRKFAANINFVSKRKQNLLSGLLNKNWNTNVDVVPEVKKIFQEIYNIFYFQLYDVKEVRALKDGVYNPSPEKLKEVIRKIENKIGKFEKLKNKIDSLNKLLELDSIIDAGKNDKSLNSKLWSSLGYGWQLMKLKEVSPNSANAFKALGLLETGFNLSMPATKKMIYSGFKEMGLLVKHFDKSLQNALVHKLYGNTRYERLQKAAAYIKERYEKKLENLVKVKLLLNKLELLANSDLFWDPIKKIEKSKNKKEKYVYDLTVDNEVFLAGFGGMFVHNSYAVKLEILRSLMLGTEVFVIDPEDEYKFLSDTVGGVSVKVSIGSDSHINPFDLPKPLPDEDSQDVLRGHILALSGLLKLMLGELKPEEESMLDEALNQTYAVKDITPASDFQNISPPLLSDFQSILEGMVGTESLVIRLKKYTEGTFSGFLNQPTNISLNNRLIVFSIRDMEEELRPIAMYLVLNYIWTQVRTQLKKRILAVDEAWWLLKYETGGAFLLNIAKRARKYFLGLTTISQDIPDFMNSPYGKPIITNSSLQLLMKQSPASIELVQQTFNLTDAEKYILLQSRVGHGLFFAGLNHVGIRVVASYTEDQIITSDPRQLLEIEQAKKELAQQNG